MNDFSNAVGFIDYVDDKSKRVPSGGVVACQCGKMLRLRPGAWNCGPACVPPTSLPLPRDPGSEQSQL